MLFRVVFFSFIALSVFSCGPDYLYQEQKEIPNGQWTYQDTLDFRFSITDTTQLYNLFADFEFVDTFRTQNIYVQLHTQFPNGKRMSKIRSLDLFDTQGNAAGKCSGHSCTSRILLQDKAYFNLPGEYKITMAQYTRFEPLEGIRSVGFAVEKTGAARPSGKK